MQNETLKPYTYYMWCITCDVRYFIHIYKYWQFPFLQLYFDNYAIDWVTVRQPCNTTSLSTKNYHQTFNIRCILVGNIIVDHSDVVGALPVSAAPTTSSLST